MATEGGSFVIRPLYRKRVTEFGRTSATARVVLLVLEPAESVRAEALTDTSLAVFVPPARDNPHVGHLGESPRDETEGVRATSRLGARSSPFPKTPEQYRHVAISRRHHIVAAVTRFISSRGDSAGGQVGGQVGGRVSVLGQRASTAQCAGASGAFSCR